MNDEQLLRYSRHILLSHVDIEGQQSLLDAHVVVVGLGGLGSPVSLYLAAAGVGHLTLVDDDSVALSNLQRQLLYSEAAVGQKKAQKAGERLKEINSEIIIDTIDRRLQQDEMLQLVKGTNVLVDCTDNFATRFMMNVVSRKAKIPFVSAAAIRYEGQVSVYDPRQHGMPCYRCLYEDHGELEQSCSESGVLAPMLGVIGGVQAIETIKLIVGIGETLAGRLLIFDALAMNWREIKLKPDQACPVCTQ